MASGQNEQLATMPERERRLRPTRVGVVSSDVRDKTITVLVEFSTKHTKYGKYMRRRTKYQVHDDKNEAIIGDRVEIAECRPLSKTKNWRLVRILDKAPRGASS